MDGTALYEAVAAIYISQSIGESMTIGRVILVRCVYYFPEPLHTQQKYHEEASTSHQAKP